MPYRICKQIVVENGHMLSKHPAACRYPHGHTRRVEFVLEAETLDDRDMVCDFKVIQEAVKEFVQSFDHAMCMNTSDPRYGEMKAAYGDHIIGFENQDPTTEVMAKTLFDAAHSRLATYAMEEGKAYPLSREVTLVKVRVWETETSWAEYRSPW
ncbi:MAG TPA: 6-carboxytetrahydropterin synthase [Kiritimatiellia bacterium]|nr:6-carboxytetrahydropterin synthase [Kiritimatiellia bacterium]